MADEITRKNEVTGAAVERTRDRKTYIPRVDIFEEGESLYVLADMPGADENSVNITLEKDQLTIEAHVDESLYGQGNVAYAEFGVGDYYRTFTLSEVIDREKIKASMKNGVLQIALPKAEPHRAKKIAINAG
jgi:HSP20 family protein